MRFSFLLLAGLLCGGAASAAPLNLVSNAGFEEALAGDLPAGGWWLYEARGKPEFKLDFSEAHQGKRCLRLSAKEQTKCTVVSPRFEVSSGDEIRLSAWVRASQLPPERQQTSFGLAFRQADGKVFERAYVACGPLSNHWGLLSAVIKAPSGALWAEVHLGYTNAPGILWFDDVEAVFLNPLSLRLLEEPKAWPGQQQLRVRLTNRQTNGFSGSLSAAVGPQRSRLPVLLQAQSSGEFLLPLEVQRVGLHTCSLSLLDSAGASLRELETKVRIQPPLTLYPACPCYLVAGSGQGLTRVDGRVNLAPAQRQGLQLHVELLSTNGQSLQSASTDASGGELVGLQLKVPIERAGAFEVRAQLRGAEGKLLAQASTPLHVAPPGLAQVQVGPDGFVRVAGKPHLPIGMYSCGHYEEMSQAGFSATHSYGVAAGEPGEAINSTDLQLQQVLDKSWSNGMRMMVELPRQAIEKAQWSQVRRRVLTFRHHPGLLCWGSEERVARGEAPLANIEALYRLVHELDPNHPLVLGDTREVIGKLQQDRRNFFPDSCMDAGIWWWYPIPLKEPDGNGLETSPIPAGLLQPPSWLTTSLSKKPLWIAIQSYQQPSLQGRFPTPTEYRCMAYLSLINGAKALWFYTGSGQRDHAGKPSGLLNRPQEGHWDYVQSLVSELRQLSPLFLAPAPSNSVTLLPAQAPVDFALRRFDGALYLLAANKSEQAQSVRFDRLLGQAKRVQVLFENRAVSTQGDSLVEHFGPLAVHVYRVE